MYTRPIYQTIPAGFTGTYVLNPGSPTPSVISNIVLDVLGMSGTMIPQSILDNDGITQGTPNYANTAYSNVRTQVSYSAGSSITVDGMYQFPADASHVSMNVTVAPSIDVVLRVRLLEGSAPSGSGSGGGAVTIADGADVAEGATTDAAITTNTTGTISGKLRGLVAILADVWVSASHYLKVTLTDGTSSVAIKAASTAALATDPALVVSVSPNSVAPVKQNPASATVTQVSLSTSAAQIVAANSTRSGLVIKNIDTSITVYLGTSSGVTSANGYALVAGESVALSITANAWYGIAASATPKVAAIEV